MDNLVYISKSTRSGNTIATFLILADAQKYIKELESREGVHSPKYRLEKRTKININKDKFAFWIVIIGSIVAAILGI